MWGQRSGERTMKVGDMKYTKIKIIHGFF